MGMRRASWLLWVAFAACRSASAPAPAESFAAIPKFDVHTHIAPGGMARARKLFAAAGIEAAVNLSGGETPERLAAQIAAGASGRILTFANLDWDGALRPGWVEAQVAWLRRARALGAAGLKIFKSLGLTIRDPAGALIAIDDPRLDPIFEEAGRLGMPVAIHAGDPKAFFEPVTPANERFAELSLNPSWSFADRSVFPSWEALFGQFSRRIARHPGTTFIGVHFGNDPEEPARVAKLLDGNPNLYVDTAARVGEIGRKPPEALRAIFLAHRRRILFGTDVGVGPRHLTLGAPEPRPATEADAPAFYAAHWRFFETARRGIDHPTPIQGSWKVDGIGLPPDVLEDFYHRNAERLFHLAPLPRPGAHPRSRPPAAR